MNNNSNTELYSSHDSSFLVNWAGKTIRPIRISLPSPPPLELIDGYGLNPEQQVFRPLTIPIRLIKLEQDVRREYSDKDRGITACRILNRFWELLENRREDYKTEIEFIKKVIYYMFEGYWCFIDGKPTYIPGWYFSYLNFNKITLKVGFGLPEYREDSRLRWCFREYLYNTTETFADLDIKTSKAFKVEDENGNMVYRMIKTGKKLFVGSIEPKGRRKGLTNEYCHILIRLGMSNRGSDRLCTIVSMGGENAETHFKKKLIPAFNNLPLWIKAIYRGGMILQGTSIEFASKDYSEIGYLGTTINYTDSGGDLANDGKMIIGAGFDEQGKGKRLGNVQNRWHVNREAMSLGAGEGIVGFCMHPSTVEQMSEGGQDYKDMCDLSDFYTRTANGQTQSGLAVLFLPDDYCLEFYMDKFGQAVYENPTERQIRLGFNKTIGSKTYIANTRKSLYDPNNPTKMVAYRSFVRKHPIWYEECWTGIAGQLGLPNELIRKRKTELEIKSETVHGEFEWVSRLKLSVVFVESQGGRWTVAKILAPTESCRVTTMEQYSAFEKDDIIVNRPAGRIETIVGVDSHQFSNKSEARFIEAKNTKKSETGISVLQRRNKNLDISTDPKKWKSRKFIASFQGRLDTSAEQADEALKAAVYYNGLINIEINRREVWEEIVKQKMGGYLNFKLEILANGEPKMSYTPGTSITGFNKSSGFTLLADYLIYNWDVEPIYEILNDCDEISSMEELTKYDRLASALQALFGDESLYPDYLSGEFEDQELENSGFVLGAETFRI
jgi:hypothetical protein